MLTPADMWRRAARGGDGGAPVRAVAQRGAGVPPGPPGPGRGHLPGRQAQGGGTSRAARPRGREPNGPRRRPTTRRGGASRARRATREGVPAHRRPGRMCRTGPETVRPVGWAGPGQPWLPKSERRSRRSGAKSETRETRAPLLDTARTSRDVISRISRVASSASHDGTAGPASTARWRSRRVLDALLPQLMAGTRALLRIAICSMRLPTQTRAPDPGRLTLPSRHVTRASAGPRFTFPARVLTF